MNGKQDASVEIETLLSNHNLENIFNEFMINVFQETQGRGGDTYNTYIHTDIQTYTPSDEVGCRGAFAPKKDANGIKNLILNIFVYSKMQG